MLCELHIENLGVIERADVVLGQGLTVITGETGAGKTMIVEALDLVVGGRADPVIVRTGADEARVDARFVTVVDGTERELVLTRVVPVGGRSRAYVDGRPTTAAALGEVAGGLVDLHGQHAHQRLLATSHQRQALDAFGRVDLEPLRAARARIVEIDAELAALGGDARSRAHELDLLRYQLAELEQAAISDPDEDAALSTLEDTLGDAVEHQRSGGVAHHALTADGGGRDSLAEAVAALSGRAPYAAVSERLAALLAELDDVAATLQATIETIEPDPERLAHTVERRQLLRDLCRKYGDDLTAVIAFEADAAQRLAELESFDERAAALDARRTEAAAGVERAADVVCAARMAAAPKLAAAVTARLRELAMPNATVEIDVARSGADDPGDLVQFLIAPNPGMPPLPLARIASGGELARTMLAVRLALGGHRVGIARPATAVFDEVDAGIGGSAAVAVGQALAEIAADTQVIVVTHLAQVAAAATTQLSVAKQVRGRGARATTATEVRTVADDERVAEIARMLSGDTGEAAEDHARELLLRSQAAR